MMTANRILQLNAVTTAISAAAMLRRPALLYPLFGLSSPLWLDVATIVFIAYAAALRRGRQPDDRPASRSSPSPSAMACASQPVWSC